MFALRGIDVSLAFFVLVYCMLSLLVVVAWRFLRHMPVTTARGVANLLFAARVFPLLGSTVITLFVVVPSFDILEPRSIDEHMGARPVVLGVCAVVLLAWGILRVVAAQTKTSRLVSKWFDGAAPLDSGANLFRSKEAVPPLTLVGVCRPKVLVSESTVASLNSDELRIALKHEIAHLRSRDNLKKLAFRFAPFPGMAELEKSWSQAAELAADDAAVASLHDAVDLAGALVKLSRLIPVTAIPACTVGFVSGSIQRRVARLLAWEARRAPAARNQPWYTIAPIAGILLAVVLTYGPALAVTHELTEWLVR